MLHVFSHHIFHLDFNHTQTPANTLRFIKGLMGHKVIYIMYRMAWHLSWFLYPVGRNMCIVLNNQIQNCGKIRV